MEDYTDKLLQQPAQWLRALSVCLGGDWIDNGERFGFTVSHDRLTTDVEFDASDDTLTVSTLGMHRMRWSASLSTCELTQRIDDGQLFTELASFSGNGSDHSHSLAVWGPRARYRGGPIKIQEPDIGADEYILDRIVKDL